MPRVGSDSGRYRRGPTTSIHLALDAYCALYIVRDDPSRMIVLDIGHRKDVYR